MSEPRLPPELERKIFEIALWDNTRCIYLLLTARRTYGWLKPLLYRAIVIDNPDKLDLLASTITLGLLDPHFLARTVREIKLKANRYNKIDTYVPSNIYRLLDACPSLTSLDVGNSVVDGQCALTEKISRLPLECLSTGIFTHVVFAELNKALLSSPNLPIARSLTHLKVANYVNAFKLDNFHALTHFAIGSGMNSPLSVSRRSAMASIVADLLQRTGPKYAVLEVVVLDRPVDTLGENDLITTDYRVLDMPLRDEPGFWEEAEEIVSMRKLASTTKHD